MAPHGTITRKILAHNQAFMSFLQTTQFMRILEIQQIHETPTDFTQGDHYHSLSFRAKGKERDRRYLSRPYKSRLAID